MKQIRDKVGGLDVHRDSVVACTRVTLPDGAVEVAKERFATTQAGLAELTALYDGRRGEHRGHGGDGDLLADGLLRPRRALRRAVALQRPTSRTYRGEKRISPMPSGWLMWRRTGWCALLRAPPEIRELRELTRYRKTQIDARAKEIQRLEKILQDAGVKLTSVASTVWSVSSRAMIEAMIAGERDSVVLAGMAKGVMRNKIDRLEVALEGNFGPHHAILCRQVIDHLDFLDASIATLSAEICARLVPFEPQVALLTSIPGISATTAQVIVAETGADMSRFPTAGHLCAWAGVARPATSQRARSGRPGPARAHRGSGAPSSKPPARRRAPRAATTRPSTPASPGVGDPTRPRSPWPTPCSRPPGTCSAPVPSTKTPVPTTSSAVTIRPLRQSGSNAGSRPSGSPSPSPRRLRRHTLSTTPPRLAPTGASFRAPMRRDGFGISPEVT